MKSTLVILAAGLGSRFGKEGAKQVTPVGPTGEIIAEYSVYDAAKAGFNKVIFVIKKENEEAFSENIVNKMKGSIQTAYAFQSLDDLPEGYTCPEGRIKPWGTGHALLSCRELIAGDECYAVINADDFYGFDTFSKLATFLKQTSEEKNLNCMVGFNVANTVTEHGFVSRGLCKTNKDGFLVSVTEKEKVGLYKGKIVSYEAEGGILPLEDTATVSMNAWGFKGTTLKYIAQSFEEFIKENIDKPSAEFYLPKAVDDIMKNNSQSFKVLKSSEKWFGITHPGDKDAVSSAVSEMVKAGKYPNNLWHGDN